MKGFLSLLLTWAILFSLTSCANLSGQSSRDNTTEEDGAAFSTEPEDSVSTAEQDKTIPEISVGFEGASGKPLGAFNIAYQTRSYFQKGDALPIDLYFAEFGDSFVKQDGHYELMIHVFKGDLENDNNTETGFTVNGTKDGYSKSYTREDRPLFSRTSATAVEDYGHVSLTLEADAAKAGDSGQLRLLFGWHYANGHPELGYEYMGHSVLLYYYVGEQGIGLSAQSQEDARNNSTKQESTESEDFDGTIPEISVGFAEEENGKLLPSQRIALQYPAYTQKGNSTTVEVSLADFSSTVWEKEGHHELNIFTDNMQKPHSPITGTGVTIDGTEDSTLRLYGADARSFLQRFRGDTVKDYYKTTVTLRFDNTQIGDTGEIRFTFAWVGEGADAEINPAVGTWQSHTIFYYVGEDGVGFDWSVEGAQKHYEDFSPLS
jgi:hypothetical protein